MAVRVVDGGSLAFKLDSGLDGLHAFVHRLSKPARRELVRLAVLAAGNSMSGLAEEVGVSRQSISKFMSGQAHPSDRVVLRLLEVIAGASPYVRREAARVLRGEMEAVVSGYAAALELLGPEG